MTSINLSKNSLDLSEELNLLNLMLDASVDCIKLIDCSGNIIRMNQSGCAALGVPYGETAFGMKWLDLLPPDVRRRGRRALAIAVDGRRASFAGKSQIAGQPTVFWDNILTPIYDASGVVSAILCLSRDVTRRLEAEQRLKTASNTDALTRIPNRRMFRAHVDRQLRKAESTGNKTVGLTIIDLDNFKEINDVHGHHAGDAVLKYFSKVCCRVKMPDEFVARLGGDEFVLVLNSDPGQSRLDRIIANLKLLLAKPLNYRGRKIFIKFSAGAAYSSETVKDGSSLLKLSDIALYAAKNAGRDGYKVFGADTRERRDYA